MGDSNQLGSGQGAGRGGRCAAQRRHPGHPQLFRNREIPEGEPRQICRNRRHAHPVEAAIEPLGEPAAPPGQTLPLPTQILLNNVIYAGAGNNSLVGGDGTDTLSVTTATAMTLSDTSVTPVTATGVDVFNSRAAALP